MGYCTDTTTITIIGWFLLYIATIDLICAGSCFAIIAATAYILWWISGWRRKDVVRFCYSRLELVQIQDFRL